MQIRFFYFQHPSDRQNGGLMSQINVSNLTFSYEGSYDNIFENISFSIDTNWKLGFIGRNGKGKTTFLNLLLGKYEYQGAISTNTVFDYFPYRCSADDLKKSAYELMEYWKPGVESWRVSCELPQLDINEELLYRAFGMLSFGERTKIMLAVLFSGENDFLLIDEPTNHLDQAAREIIKNYLSSKKGFILVSHDRDLLDACIDHVLVLNRESIEVQAGNFTSWWNNKEKADHFARMENEKHQKEIHNLKTAADRASRWADKNENTKIGYDPRKERDRSISTRSYIGAKTKKMQSRVSSYEARIQREITEKEGLLNDIETVKDLKLMPLSHYKDRLIACKDLSLRYRDGACDILSNLTFELHQGDRLFLKGTNGCGKSSLIRYLLASVKKKEETISLKKTAGTIYTVPELKISYINQDTSHLSGKLKDFARKQNLDYTLLLSTLRNLDMDRVQFEKNMEHYSEGQKKKVLIAASLLTSAHLYIWDEPLNYIDVFSRMQIEKLIDQFHPTMLIVEHDARFMEKLATQMIDLDNYHVSPGNLSQDDRI